MTTGPTWLQLVTSLPDRERHEAHAGLARAEGDGRGRAARRGLRPARARGSPGGLHRAWRPRSPRRVGAPTCCASSRATTAQDEALRALFDRTTGLRGPRGRDRPRAEALQRREIPPPSGARAGRCAGSSTRSSRSTSSPGRPRRTPRPPSWRRRRPRRRSSARGSRTASADPSPGSIAASTAAASGRPARRPGSTASPGLAHQTAHRSGRFLRLAQDAREPAEGRRRVRFRRRSVHPRRVARHLRGAPEELRPRGRRRAAAPGRSRPLPRRGRDSRGRRDRGGDLLTGAKQQSRDDDQLLKHALALFDWLYAAYT